MRRFWIFVLAALVLALNPARPTMAADPGAREGATMALHRATESLVLFGGRGPNGLLDDTLTWHGNNWKREKPATRPPAREFAAMAEHPLTNTVVLFGGRGEDGSPLGDTWTWDGTNWTRHTPAQSPPPRFGTAMAFDGFPGFGYPDGAVVLFGGAGPNPVGAITRAMSDTWTWNGVTWTLQQVTAFPSARWFHVLAADPLRQVVLLFGGRDGLGTFGDTWTWDGLFWLLRDSASSPLGRELAGATWSEQEGEVIIFGGRRQGSQGPILFDDTWSWSGMVWTKRTVTTRPPSRASHAMAAHASGDVVVFGGRGESGLLGDTWTFDGQRWRQRLVE